MKRAPSSLSGVLVIETAPYRDRRGQFVRLYCERTLAGVLTPRRIVQVSQSRTHAVGAVRGLHFQLPPCAEMKLVRCIRGRVWDVVVDLRAGSPTFLRWHAEELSGMNERMMLIPEGCAHGFQVLEEDSELLYLTTAPYEPAAERGLRYSDARLGIQWPLPVADISDRDLAFPLLHEDYQGVVV